ncbi:hypothetical protein jhhlp_007498 [Lomentospora prolificans]|uniref:Uncharacterized protein n=1 Tax=Lomentospora prolificans TaxID=41688 RepID=A0A2N3N191_9PEZI|nr:hypothetical protein jhhlp_007498 [Lomentospora prolificans]
MRLLNVRTLEIKEFSDREIPPYAILSHTWGVGEVLLQDIQGNRAKAQRLRGYRKITGCCEQAKKDGLEYVWIDTCCIDKTSSTELAEAINSMFTWYRKSIICYAYLEDLNSINIKDEPRLLCNSRWFARGWTLQELIAPGIVVFFDHEWKEIGSRDDFVAEISEATGIDYALFFDGKLSNYSVAQRMSWAAKRQTTRVEDEAYCLLGIFGVNMPLLYGEGKMAFIRLQEEIMRRSDDQSIFVWTMTDTATSGLLAPSPSCFAGAKDVRRIADRTYESPFFLTNKGIQITLPILGLNHRSGLPAFEPMASAGQGPKIVVTPPDSLIAVLGCQNKGGQRIAIAIDRSEDSEQFHRINADLGPLFLDAEDCRRNSELKRILIKPYQLVNELSLWEKLRPTFFGIRVLQRDGTAFDLTHNFGNLTIEAGGVAFAKLSAGNRMGMVFSDRNYAFGVFVGESSGSTGWEIVTGSSDKVMERATQFQHKDDKLLTSLASWRLPLGDPESKELQVSMQTQRRPHGFSSTLMTEKWSGGIFTPQPPYTFDDLKPFLDHTKKAAVESIGVKNSTKMPEVLGTKFVRGNIYRGDVTV